MSYNNYNDLCLNLLTLTMGGLEMIIYIKCGNVIEMVEIYSNNDARLQGYVVDGNVVLKYAIHGTI